MSLGMSIFLAVCEFVSEGLSVSLYDFLMFILACFILKEEVIYRYRTGLKNVIYRYSTGIENVIYRYSTGIENVIYRYSTGIENVIYRYCDSCIVYLCQMA